jgi:hypothetical protein
MPAARWSEPHSAQHAPTLASTWQAAAAVPLSDGLLEWPPDVFAFTELILERTQVYRLLFPPPRVVEWPPRRLGRWSEAVEEAGKQWSGWAEDQHGPAPELVAEEWGVIRERADTPLGDVSEGRDWRLCEAILTLHAVADEACAGLGVALDSAGGQGCIFRARGRELLARTGSLARLPGSFQRVLPKARTTPNGTSIRSFSRYACLQRAVVDVGWYKVPARHAGTDPRTDHANLLLLPWPLQVRESDFRAAEGSVQDFADETFGLFEFSPTERLDLDLVSRVLVAARDEVESIENVCLPESAVDEVDIDDLEAVLADHGVIHLITGVRQRSAETEGLPRNWVHTGLNPTLVKGAPLPTSRGDQWLHMRQHKFHRWSLDESQIYQYRLGSALHPMVRWWEGIEVPRQELQFLELGEAITLASLVCEDLAQIDDVAEILRSVGPTIVVALLLDGPQLSSRWSARYASVLADDPGSAVLTLTSFGMAQRSRPEGRDASAVVALWKDPNRGTREIPLEPGAHAVLLTTCGGRGSRRTVDGRRPVDNVTDWFNVGVSQIRAAPIGSGPPSSVSRQPRPRLLDILEVTILTSFAQALAEAVENAPDRVEDVLAEAPPGHPWRAKLGIVEPSTALREAFAAITRATREVPPTESAPTLDTFISALDSAWNEEGIERLAREVFRSALEQRRFRTRETTS